MQLRLNSSSCCIADHGCPKRKQHPHNRWVVCRSLTSASLLLCGATSSMSYVEAIRKMPKEFVDYDHHAPVQNMQELLRRYIYPVVPVEQGISMQPAQLVLGQYRSDKDLCGMDKGNLDLVSEPEGTSMLVASESGHVCVSVTKDGIDVLPMEDETVEDLPLSEESVTLLKSAASAAVTFWEEKGLYKKKLLVFDLDKTAICNAPSDFQRHALSLTSLMLMLLAHARGVKAVVCSYSEAGLGGGLPLCVNSLVNNFKVPIDGIMANWPYAYANLGNVRDLSFLHERFAVSEKIMQELADDIAPYNDTDNFEVESSRMMQLATGSRKWPPLADDTAQRALHFRDLAALACFANFKDRQIADADLVDTVADKGCKNLMFLMLRKYFGVEFKDMFFFDDSEAHIRMAAKLGIDGYYVSKKRGIDLDDHRTYVRVLEEKGV